MVLYLCTFSDHATTIQIDTPAHNGLYVLTRKVREIESGFGVKTGMVYVNVQVATQGS